MRVFEMRIICGKFFAAYRPFDIHRPLQAKWSQRRGSWRRMRAMRNILKELSRHVRNLPRDALTSTLKEKAKIHDCGISSFLDRIYMIYKI